MRYLLLIILIAPAVALAQGPGALVPLEPVSPLIPFVAQLPGIITTPGSDISIATRLMVAQEDLLAVGSHAFHSDTVPKRRLAASAIVQVMGSSWVAKYPQAAAAL